MWIQEDALARGALSHVEEKVRMCKTAYAHMREVVHICTENRYKKSELRMMHIQVQYFKANNAKQFLCYVTGIYNCNLYYKLL